MLLEAGEENVPTVLNTILAEHPTDNHETLLMCVENALKSLEKRSCVDLEWYRDGWVPLSAEERRKVLALADCVVWHEDTREWNWNEKELGPEWPIVTLTEKGEQYIEAVLEWS